jgi:MFS family permease
MMTIREPARLVTTPKKKADRSRIVEFYASNWKTILFHHAAFMMLVVMGYSFVFWTPSFFERVHGIAAERASIVYGLTFIIAGGFGTASSAMLAQKWMAKGRRDALIVIAIAGAIGLVATVLTIQLAQTALAAFLLYIPALVFLNVPFGLSFAALPIIAPPDVRAQVAAIYMLILSIGNALGPPLTGWLSDNVFTERGGILYSLVAMTSLFGTVGIVLLWAGRRHFADSVARTENLQPPVPN